MAVWRVGPNGPELMADISPVQSVNGLTGNVVVSGDTVLSGSETVTHHLTEIHNSLTSLGDRIQVSENDQILVWENGGVLQAFLRAEVNNGILTLLGRPLPGGGYTVIGEPIQLSLGSLLVHSETHEFDGTNWSPNLPMGAGIGAPNAPGIYLVLGFQTGADVDYTFIDVRDMRTDFVEGPGINIDGGEISIRMDNDTYHNLSVSQDNGLRFTVPRFELNSDGEPVVPPGFRGMFFTPDVHG
jgi:hypothetical protein